MWMTDYISAVKRGLRDSHGFVSERTVGSEPIFADGQIPDGIYPVVIEGKIDYVRITGNAIHCCNYEAIQSPLKGESR